MKEARIDKILASITKTILVYLPEEAVDPNVFYEENLVRRDEICMLKQQLHCSKINTYFTKVKLSSSASPAFVIWGRRNISFSAIFPL